MKMIVRNPTLGIYPASSDYVHAMEVQEPARFLYVAGTMGLDERGIAYVHLAALGTPKEGRLAARSGQYDVLAVTGSAALAGTLNVTPTGGYVPTAGDSFTVIEAPAVSGTFAAITKPFANTINPSYAPASV